MSIFYYIIYQYNNFHYYIALLYINNLKRFQKICGLCHILFDSEMIATVQHWIRMLGVAQSSQSMLCHHTSSIFATIAVKTSKKKADKNDSQSDLTVNPNTLLLGMMVASRKDDSDGTSTIAPAILLHHHTVNTLSPSSMYSHVLLVEGIGTNTYLVPYYPWSCFSSESSLPDGCMTSSFPKSGVDERKT
jgi:hypothetical protein